jgi:hypothetical protein
VTAESNIRAMLSVLCCPHIAFTYGILFGLFDFFVIFFMRLIKVVTT